MENPTAPSLHFPSVDGHNSNDNNSEAFMLASGSPRAVPLLLHSSWSITFSQACNARVFVDLVKS